MALLNDDVRGRLGGLLQALPAPVALALYGGADAEAAELVETLLGEVVALSPATVSLRLVAEPPPVEPGRKSAFAAEGPILTVASASAEEARMRFLGVPGGHEFGSLVAAIEHASAGRTELQAATLEALGALGHRVHIQVFTTPT